MHEMFLDLRHIILIVRTCVASVYGVLDELRTCMERKTSVDESEDDAKGAKVRSILAAVFLFTALLLTIEFLVASKTLFDVAIASSHNFFSLFFFNNVPITI